MAAALLFGAGTPLGKQLLTGVDPWMPAGQWVWLAGAVLAGAVVGPLLLMFGLTRMPASGASLLLNAEGVFTALLAWFAFKENFERRIALGMLTIVAGAAVLSWPGETEFGAARPALAVLGACLARAIDNKLMRKVALNDATWIAAGKDLHVWRVGNPPISVR
jgi:drug/metabolite transporter (DMT)-like permease